jgi:hypothetical protein
LLICFYSLSKASLISLLYTQFVLDPEKGEREKGKGEREKEKGKREKT